jgi:hypothetical protein
MGPVAPAAAAEEEDFSAAVVVVEATQQASPQQEAVGDRLLETVLPEKLGLSESAREAAEERWGRTAARAATAL